MSQQQVDIEVRVLTLVKFKSIPMRLLAPLLASCLIVSHAQAMPQSCEGMLVKNKSTNVRIRQKIKVLAFNLANLFIKEAAEQRGDVKEILKTDVDFKTKQQLDWERKIIKEEDPDIFVATEVHLDEDARKFMDLDPVLKGKYWSFLKVGNDDRGINIGIYVKKALNFLVKLTSHKDLKWTDPVTKQTVPLFSRDLPVLTLTREGEEIPFLLIIGNHAKSKRPSPQDPESVRHRTAQYEAAAKIIADLKKLYGDDIPIIMAGDFNADVIKGTEIEAIRSQTKSVFESIPGKTFSLDERISHFFFTGSGKRIGHPMDDIRVSGNADVISAKVIRYENSKGKTLGIPKNFDERAQLPSDHYPVVSEIEVY